MYKSKSKEMILKPAREILSAFLFPGEGFKEVPGSLKESQIELQILNYLFRRLTLASIPFLLRATKASGYFDPKIGRFKKHRSPYAKPGWPDAVLVVRGLFYALEMKSAKGKQSQGQKEFEEELKIAGGKYFLLRSVDEAEKLVDSVLLKGASV